MQTTSRPHSYWRARVLVPVGIAPLIFGAVQVSCDLPAAPGSASPLGGPAAAVAGCPDMMNASAVASFDWQKEFGLDAKVTKELKAGLLAAISLHGVAMEIDGELKVACGNIAKDLGNGGKWDTGADACRAAISAIGAAKAKLGGSARIHVAIEPPRCAASMSAAADCVGKCDVDVKPGKVDVKCEGGEIVGKCEGKCNGSCHVDAGAKCEGTCKGSCEANFSGKCGGTCEGKCNGKNLSGHCDGKCEGKCDAEASGQCGGGCKGECDLKGSASCQGECEGKCSVEMKEPRCTGEVEPPKASAECKAQCDAEVSAKVTCQPARAVVVVEGAADAKVAAQYKAALEKNLPAVLKVAVGLKDRLPGVAADVEAAVKGVQASIQAAGQANATIATRLGACVAAPFKAAFDAAASVKASVNVSVEVKASASASGSAGGKAGGKTGG